MLTAIDFPDSAYQAIFTSKKSLTVVLDQTKNKRLFRNTVCFGCAGAIPCMLRGGAKDMARHRCFWTSLFLCALSLICSTESALAQVTSGRIAGVVTDSSGSTLPDVAV